jgi:NADH-quinone oxidoreductase subunit C
MSYLETLTTSLQTRFAGAVQALQTTYGELTLEIAPQDLREVCFALRDEPEFKFELLLDVCGVDYLHYGISEWVTEKATGSGFERGVANNGSGVKVLAWNKPRFAVVYHFLSITHNQRLRLRVFVEGEPPILPTVIDIWPSSNWYEREAFDLYGIVFDGHPDLRRILTDYGFVGHPFRKDFPLIGNVEVRYDATLGRVVYEPVTIESRTLVPKVIRAATPPVATPIEEGTSNV